jgi:hypothetical protein
MMKLNVLVTAFTALVGLSSASPMEKRAHVAYITFIGAADTSFSMDFPTDGTPTQISMYSESLSGIAYKCH